MKMRTALAKSKNMVSIRILQSIGTHYAQDYATRFGFDAAKHPPYLTMALGAGSVTPWQMVTAYSVFANGGFRVNPFIVREIRDGGNQVLALSAGTEPGDETSRVIDPRNAFMMDAMLRDVTIYGTAAKASAILKRQDLAGKTGTTNEYVDAWFCGYQMTVSGCAWIGFDQPRKLGDKETGGAAALPIWIGYMSRALKDVPILLPQAPEGLVAYGEGKQRSYVYAENAAKEKPPEEAAQEAAPLPKPDLTTPPSD
jgi:penicillin-binding protein 1A